MRQGKPRWANHSQPRPRTYRPFTPRSTYRGGPPQQGPHDYTSVYDWGYNQSGAHMYQQSMPSMWGASGSTYYQMPNPQQFQGKWGKSSGTPGNLWQYSDPYHETTSTSAPRS